MKADGWTHRIGPVQFGWCHVTNFGGPWVDACWYPDWGAVYVGRFFIAWHP